MKNLLSPPTADSIAAITAAMDAAKNVFPVPGGHRRDLPFAVRDLSRILTAERGDMGRSYWATPRLLSAYVHFFLPWNLFRLSWLLPGLPMELRPGARILDLGSGPLTLPLAMWCARPELRTVPLRFVCWDVAGKPMELGRDILRALVGEGSPWTVELARGPLDAALGGGAETADAVFAGNVLNELPSSRQTPLEERLSGIMSRIARMLAPGGYFFNVEPGTRLGGKMVSLARKGGLENGLRPLVPCPHEHPCPMLEQPWFYPPSPPFSGWCHFVHRAEGAPKELQQLGFHARLEKDSLALSCMLLRKDVKSAGAESRAGLRDGRGDRSFDDDSLEALEELYAETMRGDDDAADARSLSAGRARNIPAGGRDERVPGGLAAHAGRGASGDGMVRVISGLIRLPDAEEPGRYACSERGLALLMDAVRVPSGGAAAVRWPAQEERDAKTGALILERRQGPAKRKEGEGPKGGESGAAKPLAGRRRAKNERDARPGDRQDARQDTKQDGEQGKRPGRRTDHGYVQRPLAPSEKTGPSSARQGKGVPRPAAPRKGKKGPPS